MRMDKGDGASEAESSGQRGLPTPRLRGQGWGFRQMHVGTAEGPKVRGCGVRGGSGAPCPGAACSQGSSMRLRTRVQASTLFHQPHGGAGGRGGHCGRSGGLSAHCEHRVRRGGRQMGRGEGEKRQRKQRRLESGWGAGFQGPSQEDDRWRLTFGAGASLLRDPRASRGTGRPVRADGRGPPAARPQQGHGRVPGADRQ